MRRRRRRAHARNARQRVRILMAVSRPEFIAARGRCGTSAGALNHRLLPLHRLQSAASFPAFPRSAKAVRAAALIQPTAHRVAFTRPLSTPPA